MTTIAPLSSFLAQQPGAVLRSNAASAGTAVTPPAAAPSAIVSIGQSGAANVTLYSSSGALDGDKQPVWQNKPLDAISSLMTGTATANDLAGRLQGLGKALLDHVSAGGNGYAQSVLVSDRAIQGDAGVQAILREQLQKFAGNSIGLSVTTVGGAQVDFSLSSTEDGVAVSIHVAQGTLTDSDRDALGKLGDAFQGAINGLAQQPPRLALDGLMRFDPQVLAAVDLKAKLGDASQTVTLHADAQRRMLATEGKAGNLKVDVDLKNSAILGSGEQRQRAIASYLEQVDAAARRGRGDAALTGLFKEAFSQLNASYPGQTWPLGKEKPTVAADANDRLMLSGLADFKASISQASNSPNPLMPNETDGFDYNISQQTTVTGQSQASRNIVQEQHASLRASYHESLISGVPLRLGTDRQSQNYTYHQFEDEASSRLDIGYDQGFLTKALLNQSAHQNTRVTKYVAGVQVSDVNTPLQAAIVRDFSAQLQQGVDRRQSDGVARWQQLLAQIGAKALLQSDPTALQAQGKQTLLT